MSKRSVVILIGVVVVVGIVAAITYWLNDTKPYTENFPINCLRADCKRIVRFNKSNDYRKAVKGDSQWRNLELYLASKFSDSFKLDYKLADGYNHFLLFLNDSTEDRELDIAMVEMESAECQVLSFPFKCHKEQRSYMREIAGVSSSDTVCSGTTIYKVSLPDSVNIHFMAYEKCLFASSQMSSLLSILGVHAEQPKLSDATSFSTLFHTASIATPYSLFFRHNSTEGAQVWVELDISTSSSLITGSGMMTSERVMSESAIVSVNAESISIDKYVPSISSEVKTFASGSRGLGNEQYLLFLRNNGKEDSYRERQTECFKTYNQDVEAALEEIFSNQMALVQFDNSEAFFIKGENGTLLQGKINTLLMTLNKGVEPKEVDVLSPLSSVKVPVYEAFKSDAELFFLPDILGTQKIPCRYYLRYDNCLIMADNITTLGNVLYENLLNRTLFNDAHFRNFRNNFPGRCASFVYTKRILSDESVMTEGWQMSQINNLPYICFCVERSNVNVAIERPTKWQARLGAPIIGRPYAVKNHNTGSMEVFVQDADNFVYLINSEGLTLWKCQVDAPIVGDVLQIDYYKNGKLQYLFATEKAIQLIDRNGNNTAEFPVKLNAKATSGVSFVKYDNSSDFRIFVSCDNKATYVYGPDTRLVEGWTIPHTEAVVRRPVIHYVADNKDYILIQDELRSYIVDRKGNERIKPATLFAPNPASTECLVLPTKNFNASRFVTTTIDGRFASVKIPTGEVLFSDIDVLRDLSSNTIKHHLIQLGQGSPDFAALTDSLFMRISVDEGLLSKERICISSADQVAYSTGGNIMLYDEHDHLAYIYTKEGKLLPGYPVPAHSLVAIVDGCIVVAGNDGILNCYLPD